MDDCEFYEKYKLYKDFKIDELKLIEELSFYNHNFYTGIQREDKDTPDVIYVETDELTNIDEYYHVDDDVKIHIGYSYFGDEYITLQQEELT